MMLVDLTSTLTNTKSMPKLNHIQPAENAHLCLQLTS